MLRVALDLLLHVDRYLLGFVQDYGVLVYVLLFFIIFAETGLVVFPFLPGDSLLFVAGALAGAGVLNVWALLLLLFAAAVLGNAVNYWVGRQLSHRIDHLRTRRWFHARAFDAAHEFFERHGGIAIVMARFVPLVRTFAPFVAGVVGMSRRRYQFYNVLGSGLWVGLLVLAGYWFGNLEWVKQNFTTVIYAIVVLSLAPMMLSWLRSRLRVAKAKQT